jgi:hypothetical protein
MDEQRDNRRLSRRGFAALAAAGTVSGLALGPGDSASHGRREPARRATARRHPRRSCRPFAATLTFERQDVPAEGEALRAGPGPAWQRDRCYDAQEWNRDYLHRLSADRLAAQLPRDRRARHLHSAAVGRMGEARTARCEATSRATILVGLRPDVCLHRRCGIEGQGRCHGRRVGQVPGQARRRLSQRLSDGAVRSREGAQEGLGAVLHAAQDHGRPARHASRALRQPAGVGRGGGHRGLGWTGGARRFPKRRCSISSAKSTAA